MQRRNRVFKVTVDIPDGMTPEDMGNYIHEAISTWKGQEHPDSSVFSLNTASIRVEWIDCGDKFLRLENSIIRTVAREAE